MRCWRLCFFVVLSFRSLETGAYKDMNESWRPFDYGMSGLLFFICSILCGFLADHRASIYFTYVLGDFCNDCSRKKHGQTNTNVGLGELDIILIRGFLVFFEVFQSNESFLARRYMKRQDLQR